MRRKNQLKKSEAQFMSMSNASRADLESAYIAMKSTFSRNQKAFHQKGINTPLLRKTESKINDNPFMTDTPMKKMTVGQLRKADSIYKSYFTKRVFNYNTLQYDAVNTTTQSVTGNRQYVKSTGIRLRSSNYQTLTSKQQSERWQLINDVMALDKTGVLGNPDGYGPVQYQSGAEFSVINAMIENGETDPQTLYDKLVDKIDSVNNQEISESDFYGR